MRIVRGEYTPGTNLPHPDILGASMEVTSTTIREAVKALVSKGLVESRAKVGTRVRPQEFWNSLDPDVLQWRCSSMPTGDFVRNLMEMREIIEPAAAAFAATNRNKAQLVAIEEAFRGMDQAKDVDEYAIADLHFHQAILRATNNALLVPLSHVIATALETYFLMAARRSKKYNYSLLQHLDVVKAIQKKNADAARRAMLGILLDNRNLRSGKK